MNALDKVLDAIHDKTVIYGTIECRVHVAYNVYGGYEVRLNPTAKGRESDEYQAERAKLRDDYSITLESTDVDNFDGFMKVVNDLAVQHGDVREALAGINPEVDAPTCDDASLQAIAMGE